MPFGVFASKKVHVHYNRLDSDYGGWSLWVWDAGRNSEGMEVKDYTVDDFGIMFEVDAGKARIESGRMGFLLKYGDWEEKDGGDRFLDISEKREVFLLENDGRVYFSRPPVGQRALRAFFMTENKVKVIFSRPVDEAAVKKANFRLSAGSRKMEPLSVLSVSGGSAEILFPPAGLSAEEMARGEATLESGSFPPLPVEAGNGFLDSRFHSEKRMGAFLEGGGTRIRVFSPNALKVYAVLKKDPGAKGDEREMEYAGGGIWEISVDRDLTGWYYRIKAEFKGGLSHEGTDPYARCVTAHDGWGLIIGEDEKVSPPPSFPVSEAVIYELHLRDFTIDRNSGVRFKGKYLGLAEENTVLEGDAGIKTGLAHLKELGINAVHLMPVQDYENNEESGEYNWGYMPVNFNSPEGSYATEKESAARVRELRKMISALHANGIKVIMDVVYNHTAESGEKRYNFNAIAPDYYYRRKDNGSYWNGSGCGNEFRSESPMGRKFIIDSLRYWAEEYGVDGFRFDLMGLIDRKTAYEAVRVLTEINPEMIIYGEPWAAGPSPVRGIRKGDQRGKGFAVFNDVFRDALKGNVFNPEDPGYIQASLSEKTMEAALEKRPLVMEGIRGSVRLFASSPLESVNYVSSHDNHTLFDRMDLSLPGLPRSVKEKAAFLANAIILLSQGIPFLHSGAEFFRTKKGEDNSYNLSDDINGIDWRMKREHLPFFNLYRALIKIRKEHPAFRMESAAAVEKNLKFYDEADIPLPLPLIGYVIDGASAGDSWKKIAVLINPTPEEKDVPLPPGKFRLVFDSRGHVEDMGISAEKEASLGPVSVSVLRSEE